MSFRHSLHCRAADTNTDGVDPYSTDPVSSRVLDMVKEYEKLLLDDVDNVFGKLVWYVRKDMNT